MPLNHTYRKIRCSVRWYGLAYAVLSIFLRALPCTRDWRKRTEAALYDKRMNINTRGRVEVADLGINDEDSRRQAVLYVPTPSLVFDLALSLLPIDYTRYAFIDYGCGRGAAMFKAAHYPFRCVRGVEISKVLVDDFYRNVATYDTAKVSCNRLRTYWGDAALSPLPSHSSLVLYFYQPFGQDVFDTVLGYIHQHNELRHVIILYYHPDLPNHIGDRTFLRPLDLGINKHGWNFYENKE